MKLVFKTKAKNLINLYGNLKTAKILEPLVITSKDFKNNGDEVLKNAKSLNVKKLIIRSSSSSEDSNEKSNAGAFLSVSNVSIDDKNAFFDALKNVAASMPSENDEILIQPMLEDIAMCGVAFSVDKDNFSPYFCIEYDKSGSNTSITDGSAKNLCTYYHYKNAENPQDFYMQKVILLIKELEEIYECNHLDIEFAFNKKNELFLLQVRPLVMNNKINLSNHIPLKSLKRLQKRFVSLQNPRPQIYGKRAIFGVMPDWNPAEIIGLRPKRLALSLYKEIITDSIWAIQRSNYGYKNVSSYPLMHSFLGIPYIDVRLSFNSFLPQKLSNELSEKLANYYLDKLANNKNLHDKIEFDIVFSCYDFNISKKLEKLEKHGFNQNEIKRIEFALLELTNNIIDPKTGFYKKDIEKSLTLKKLYEDIKNGDFSLLDKVYLLLKHTKTYGTLPFAGAARAGFVAMQMLNSLVEIGFFTKDEKEKFLSSLHTISKSLSQNLSTLTESKKAGFLEEFGHLRAGTYNILSPRYDENFDFYFTLQNKTTPNSHNSDEFKISNEKLKKLDILLSEHGLNINSKDFFTFLKEAIEGREHVKFEFSRLLSLAISCIEKLGDYYGIKKEDMAHLDISSILNLYSSVYMDNPKERFEGEIKANKKEFELTTAIKLPPLITHEDDFLGFFTSKINPNFITQKSITANTATEHDKELSGKIVLIASADPGYDYLFTKDIAGFITCYGGANSHMAIRASELLMPAVIGVGEEAFKKYLKANRINIECASEQINCLS